MYINMDDWSQEIIRAKDRRYLPVLYFPCLKKADGMSGMAGGQPAGPGIRPD